MLLGLMLSMLIGPVFFMVLEVSIRKGVRSAILMDIGVILGDILYLILAYFFAEKLYSWLEQYSYVRFIGAALFAAIGLVYIFKRKDQENERKVDMPELPMRKRNYLALVAKGIGLNAINPFIIIFWIGACTYAFDEYNLEGVEMVIYFATTLLTMFSIDIVKIYYANKLKKVLTQKLLNRINVVVGIILIFFGIAICFRSISDNNLANKIEHSRKIPS